jgi:hypothetical protein
VNASDFLWIIFRRIVSPVILILILPMSLAAITPIPSARESALGDAHPVLADDFASAFSNPAGIAVVDPVHRFAGIDFRLSGTFWKLENAFSGGDPAEVFPALEGNYIGLGLLGPIDVGYVGFGEAYRLYTYTSIDVLYPNIAVQSDFTFLIGAEFTGGWGHQFELSRGYTLDFGFTMKGFFEQRYFGRADIVQFFGLLQNPEYFLDYPYAVAPGLGLDTSVLIRFGEQWAVGLTVDDLLTLEFVNQYSSLRDYREGIAPELSETRVRLPYISVGGGWFPAFTDNISWFGIDGVYLSFRNLLGGLEEYPRNYLLGITAGIELTFWKFLALRGGFAEGLFTGGLGLNFGGFSMDFTIGGEELSNQPGVFSVVDIRLAFAFESYKLK